MAAGASESGLSCGFCAKHGAAIADSTMDDRTMRRTMPCGHPIGSKVPLRPKERPVDRMAVTMNGLPSLNRKRRKLIRESTGDSSSEAHEPGPVLNRAELFIA